MDPAAITAAAAAKSLSDVIFAVLKDSTRVKWRAFSNERATECMVARFNALRLVKTIWEPDRPIDLTQFYVPAHISSETGRQALTTLSDLPGRGNLTIQGIVGQGKSILLRWLAWQEVSHRSTVPLFIELRKLSTERSLKDAILEEMRTLGLFAELDLFELLADSSKLVLLLDGFDEVSPEVEPRLVTEIESLARRNPKLRIIVSTRPDSAACHLAGFRVVRLSELCDDDYLALIRKMEPDPDNLRGILTSLSARESTVGELLTTPLMVALLVLKFRSEYEVPENELAFYEGLFDLLLRKHDRSKGGFRRFRTSGLSNHDMNIIFDAFSFLTRRHDLGSFSRRKAAEVAKTAIARGATRADADAFIDDITNITCLLLFDSDEGKFVHRSVQEFHTACFIASLPEQAATKFYAHLKEHWSKWQQELRFLAMLDRVRFTKLFEIPQLEVFCQEFDSMDEDVTILERFIAVLGKTDFGYGSGGVVESIAWGDARHTWVGWELFPYATTVVKNLLHLLPNSKESVATATTVAELASVGASNDSLISFVDFVRRQRTRLSNGRLLVERSAQLEDWIPEV